MDELLHHFETMVETIVCGSFYSRLSQVVDFPLDVRGVSSLTTCGDGRGNLCRARRQALLSVC